MSKLLWRCVLVMAIEYADGLGFLEGMGVFDERLRRMIEKGGD